MKITKFRKLLAGLALASATFAQPLVADCCNPCDWDGCWDLGVDVLYWKPIHCTIDYAFKGESIVGGGEILGIQADYEWGVRARASYHGDCIFSELSYLYLNTDDAVRNHDVNSLIFPGFVERLDAKISFDYQNVDVRVGFTPCCGCCGYLQWFANARWVYLRETFSASFPIVVTTPPAAPLSDVASLGSQFNGGGLGVGTRGHLTICGDFGLNGLVNVLGVIGRRKTRPFTLSQFNQTDFDFRFNNHVSILPAIDFRVAFDYKWCCDCFSAVVELGYELNYYFNAFERATGLPSEDIRTFHRKCEDVGFAGPFLGITAYF